jgi:alpha-tubulin suppressor-like RCC1 family protein
MIGDGTTINRLLPAPVALGGNKATQVAVNGNNACALLTNGTMRCWGSNGNGINGNGLISGSQSTPGPANTNGQAVKNIALGTIMNCVILEDDTVRCWGSNYAGQMGNGTTSDYQLTPVAPSLGGLKVTHVSAGYGTVCASLEDDTMRCWGNNYNGQAGIGNKNTPLTVPTLTGFGAQKIRQISVGYIHACATLLSNEVRCWGFNNYGALGTGTTAEELIPAPTALGQQEVRHITTGQWHTCATMANNATRCWGLRSLGNPAFASGSLNPIPVVNPPKAIPSIVGAGHEHSCAIDKKENVLCWGGNSQGQLGDGSTVTRTKPVTVDIGGKAKEVSVGEQHTCAILKDGVLKCWGANNFGQLGQNNTTTAGYTLPTTVNLGGARAIQVTAGAINTCAILENGELKCWGRNENGQVGINSTVQNITTPTTVNLGGARAVQVGIGSWHTCVVLQTSTTNGNAKCWGSNVSGKLGDGTTTQRRSPVDVRLDGRRIFQIAAGRSHTCAVLEDGDALCWGDGADGRLGTGSTTDRSTPFGVSLGGRKVAGITTGMHHTCAVIKDGSTYCWGWNPNSQLGNGNTTNYQIPQPVGHPGSRNTTFVSGGTRHTCAVIDVQIYCWGDNSAYQLGDTTNITRIFPTATIIERTRYEEAVIY